MTLVERINEDLKGSMKARDAARTSVLRMAKAALMRAAGPTWCARKRPRSRC
jgi:uncharacterized protein YqeY